MRILKDGSIYLVGQLFSKSIPFLLLPYLTRKMNPDGFGELSFYASVTAFLTIIMSLSQHGALLRYRHYYGSLGIKSLVISGQLYSTFILMIGLFFSFLCSEYTLVYCLLLSYFQTLVFNHLAIRQSNKESFAYLKIHILVSILNVSLTVLFFEIFDYSKVIERLLALVFSNFLSYLFAFYLFFKSIDFSSRLTLNRLKVSFKYLLVFGIPLIPHAFSITAKGQLDRLLVYQYFTVEELGVYSAGVQLASVVQIFIAAINTAIVPYIFEALKLNKLDGLKLRRGALIILPFTILPAFIIYMIPISYFELFLGNGYSSSKNFTVLFVFAFSLVIPYLLMINYLFYLGKTGLISVCSTVSILIYCILLYCFSHFSIEMVPMASILSNLIILPILYIFTMNIEKKDGLTFGEANE